MGTDATVKQPRISDDTSTETDYRDERIRLREQVRNAESDAEQREAILRLAKIDREIHADIYEKLARE